MLSAGFDLSFLLSFLLGLVILVLAIVVREEIHPDYLVKSDNDELVTGMI